MRRVKRALALWPPGKAWLAGTGLSCVLLALGMTGISLCLWLSQAANRSPYLLNALLLTGCTAAGCLLCGRKTVNRTTPCCILTAACTALCAWLFRGCTCGTWNLTWGACWMGMGCLAVGIILSLLLKNSK